ncbi:hypothetical protein [Bradyrhizobium zhanjiangense]|uniref:hypothetical protein n=1 Tax=Bradyrhizobium zhanjiangense TaxID=1325107 RepID=UPI0010091051|nr:hypothetical protein [Bradyrhizobium zhanjiangense]
MLSGHSASIRLETAANLLILLTYNSVLFSKRALKSLNNQAGFDSAIPISGRSPQPRLKALSLLRKDQRIGAEFRAHLEAATDAPLSERN